MNDYEKQAKDFLKKTDVTFSKRYVGLSRNTLWKEKDLRPLYEVTLTSYKGEYQFDFWDCIRNAEILQMNEDDLAVRIFKTHYEDLDVGRRNRIRNKLKQMKAEATITEYDVLAAVVKSDPGMFDDFCNEYGYDEDSISAFHTYQRVCEEWKGLCKVFTYDQLEELAKIE